VLHSTAIGPGWHETRIPDRADLYFGHAQPFPAYQVNQVIRVACHQLKATPARLIAYFEGASADDAIKRAIVEREISDPLTQSSLAAYKQREIASHQKEPAHVGKSRFTGGVSLVVMDRLPHGSQRRYPACL
jgi:hypothetical protein